MSDVSDSTEMRESREKPGARIAKRAKALLVMKDSPWAASWHPVIATFMRPCTSRRSQLDQAGWIIDKLISEVRILSAIGVDDLKKKAPNHARCTAKASICRRGIINWDSLQKK